MGNKNSSTSENEAEASFTNSDAAKNSRASTGNTDEVITYEKLAERRSVDRAQTPFFRIMIGVNILAWISMVVVLVLFHYARPELITGLQEYWGIEGDTSWSEEHLSAMTIMLQVCVVLSLISIVMRAKRNRRKTDSFGVNLFILFAIAVISLITLATTLGL